MPTAALPILLVLLSGTVAHAHAPLFLLEALLNPDGDPIVVLGASFNF